MFLCMLWGRQWNDSTPVLVFLLLRNEAEESAQQVLSGPLALVGVFSPVFHEKVHGDSPGRPVDGHGGEPLVWQHRC